MALLYKMRALAQSDSSYVFWTDSEPDLDGSNAPEAVVTATITILSVGGTAEGGAGLPTARLPIESDHEIAVFLNESSAPFANSGNAGGADWTVDATVVTANQDGIIDKSADFDGTARVIAPLNTNLTGFTSVTCMAWVNSNVTSQGTWGAVFTKGSTGAYPDLNIGAGPAGSSGMSIRVRSGGTSTQYDSSIQPLGIGIWYHLALVAGPGGIFVYWDGEEVDSRSGVTIDWTGATSKPWCIGGPSDRTDRNFDGKIEDFRVISRALSQDEIKDVVGRGKINYWNNFLEEPI